MRILFWLAETRALVSLHFLLEVAMQIQSMVYSKNTAMNTYKGLQIRHFFLHLLYLSTPRPAGRAKKTARIVVRVHSQVVVRLYFPLRINIVMKLGRPSIPHPPEKQEVLPKNK